MQNPQQYLAESKNYRIMGRGAGASELHRDKGLRFVPEGYESVRAVQCDENIAQSRESSVEVPIGGTKVATTSGGGVRSIPSTSSRPIPTSWRFIDYPGPVQFKLRAALYTTSPSDPRGSWCLQWLKSKGHRRGIQRDVDGTHDINAPLKAFA